jgi:hypothetical protein
MGMININNFVKSKQIKYIYKIINSEMDSWNAIGKHWLQKYNNKFGVDFFLCKCSDIKGLDIASIPKYSYIVYFKYIISQKRLKKKVDFY